MRAKQRQLSNFESRSVFLFATLLVGAALASTVRAQASPPAPVQPTAASTQDGQSKLRLSTAQVQQAFQHMDKNKDGSLNRAEVSVFPRIEKHFERMDTNRDGKLSPSEFEEALQQAS